MENKILDSSNNETLFTGGTSRLRLFFLLPLSITILIIIFALSLILYHYKNSEIYNETVHINVPLEDLYNENIRYDVQALQTIMRALAQDEKLYDALARKNRELLLRRASPIFEDIKQSFNITHLYFTGTDSVNILRVHAPLRYGDVIERITMHQAEKSGLAAYGVELGPLGTFTLRFVDPWYDQNTHKLIGYVELGMEIDHVIDKLRNILGVQVIVLVNKEFLDRKKWESGMRALGLTPHWDRFLNVVESEQGMNTIPRLLAERLVHGDKITNNSILKSVEKNLAYRVTILPLQDATARSVAKIILLADISDELSESNKMIYMGSAIVLILGVMLIFFFYWLVGRIGRHIEKDEQALHDLATHDGLTGLYNHRFFYKKFQEELERARRFNHTVSLLMLDIDHFKSVNDTYGHQAGDAILSALSERLKNCVRSIDWVCRYGGEEITVILPETDKLGAEQAAEELRILIEQNPFDIGNDQYINITVSIGIATYPLDAQEVPLLISAVDTALYQAKEDGRNRVCAYSLTKNLEEKD
ncbi:MAG: diguanylate cyclase [Sulfurovum sp.]|nr:diguanylate cyclase [Sulfurovum sp.]